MCRGKIYYQPKIIYGKQVRKGEPFYPFLISLHVPPDAKDLLKPQVYGYTYSCEHCATELHNQWLLYESDRIPHNKRKYQDQIEKLCGDGEDYDSRPTLVSTQSLLSNDDLAEMAGGDKLMECYICARVLQSKHKVFTHPGTYIPTHLHAHTILKLYFV